MILKTLHLSVSEYDGMVRKGAFDDIPRRIELIRGEVVEMNPAGPIHDDIVAYLTDWSVEHRDKSKTRISAPTGIDLSKIESRPEPDIVWVRRTRYRDGHPKAGDVQLAIEVADSSLPRDLELKRRLYAEGGIEEYWVVDCASHVIHIFQEPKDGDYVMHQMASPPSVISPMAAPTANLDLTDLFEGE